MAWYDVRLTIRPGDDPVRLHEADLPQLAHQGLIEGEPVPVPETEPRAPARPGKRGKPRAARPAATEAGQPGVTEGNSQP